MSCLAEAGQKKGQIRLNMGRNKLLQVKCLCRRLISHYEAVYLEGLVAHTGTPGGKFSGGMRHNLTGSS